MRRRIRGALRAALPAAALAAVLGAAPAAAGQETVVLPRRPAFGFSIDPGPPPTVERVLPGSPVARAGVRPGDVLLSIDGRPATHARLAAASRRASPADTVRIVLRRNGTEREVAVVPDGRIAGEGRVVIVDVDSVQALARSYLDQARETVHAFRYDEDAVRRGLEPMKEELRRLEADSTWIRLREAWPDSLAERLGRLAEIQALRLPDFEFQMPAWSGPGRAIVWTPGGGLRGASTTALNAGLARYFPGVDKGLLVLDVEPDSPAARAGLRPGDVVVRANGNEVWNPASLRAALEGATGDLVVVRDGARISLRLGR